MLILHYDIVSYLIRKYGKPCYFLLLNISNFNRVFATISMSAQSLGRSATLVMDAKESKPAAKSILTLLDRQTLIPVNVGIVPSESFKGKVSFNEVYFKYSCRSEGRILKVN